MVFCRGRNSGLDYQLPHEKQTINWQVIPALDAKQRYVIYLRDAVGCGKAWCVGEPRFLSEKIVDRPPDVCNGEAP